MKQGGENTPFQPLSCFYVVPGDNIADRDNALTGLYIVTGKNLMLVLSSLAHHFISYYSENLFIVYLKPEHLKQFGHAVSY